jgi:hypothetical protein
VVHALIVRQDMKTSHENPQSDIAACWSILWRSVVYVPLMLSLFVTVGGIWLSRWMLPPFAILFSVAQLWTHAGLSVLAWLASVLIYRYFRLSRLYEDPPSLL